LPLMCLCARINAVSSLGSHGSLVASIYHEPNRAGYSLALCSPGPRRERASRCCPHINFSFRRRISPAKTRRTRRLHSAAGTNKLVLVRSWAPDRKQPEENPQVMKRSWRRRSSRSSQTHVRARQRHRVTLVARTPGDAVPRRLCKTGATPVQILHRSPA
jgi:hypothetical protein